MQLTLVCVVLLSGCYLALSAPQRSGRQSDPSANDRTIVSQFIGGLRDLQEGLLKTRGQMIQQSPLGVLSRLRHQNNRNNRPSVNRGPNKEENDDDDSEKKLKQEEPQSQKNKNRPSSKRGPNKGEEKEDEDDDISEKNVKQEEPQSQKNKKNDSNRNKARKPEGPEEDVTDKTANQREQTDDSNKQQQNASEKPKNKKKQNKPEKDEETNDENLPLFVKPPPKPFGAGGSMSSTEKVDADDGFKRKILNAPCLGGIASDGSCRPSFDE